MKYFLSEVFKSGKFIVGFVIFTAMLLIVIVYPLIITDRPLGIIGQGTFFPPGTYVNVFDSVNSTTYILNLPDAAAKRIDSKLSQDDRAAIKEWLVADGVPADQIDITNTKSLLDLWESQF